MTSRYILRRLLQAIPVLLVVGSIVFFMFRIIPGDPAQMMLGTEATPETLATLHREMGLDQPLAVQYLQWLKQLLRGDLGRSRLEGGQAVTAILAPKIGHTLELVILGVLFALVWAIPLGVVTAVRAGGWADQLVRVFAMAGFSTPSYWLAVLLMLCFSVKLQWFPAGGYVAFGEAGFWQHLRYLALPVFTVGVIQAASMVRFLRSGMLEVLHQEYVRTARAKGLPERTVIFRHALKNSLIPFVTVVGTNVGALMGGLVVTEQIFAWPGLGWQMVTSIMTRDYAVVQGAVLFSALIFVGVNLCVDILYAFLDPRIQYQ